uniref:DUF1653 domain-containing protein n=1 Tax=Rhizobium phage LG08 TaxID=3129229 RepID=A0AAU8HY53_9CAUD
MIYRLYAINHHSFKKSLFTYQGLSCMKNHSMEKNVENLFYIRVENGHYVIDETSAGQKRDAKPFYSFTEAYDFWAGSEWKSSNGLIEVCKVEILEEVRLYAR